MNLIKRRLRIMAVKKTVAKPKKAKKVVKKAKK